MFTIETLSNRVVKAGSFVTVESFVVVDAKGNPVDGKAYSTKEEAQGKIDSMGNFAIGLAFAQAQFPDQADKAHIGKANLIAEYLDWEAAGRPVKEAKPVAEPTPAAAVEGEPAPAAEPVASEQEEF